METQRGKIYEFCQHGQLGEGEIEAHFLLFLFHVSHCETLLKLRAVNTPTLYIKVMYDI